MSSAAIAPVRDLAGKLNKQVELTLQGSSTELDKSLIERIIDPLTHLVRNSLDHGIEEPATASPPASRRSAIWCCRPNTRAATSVLRLSTTARA